MTRGITLSLLAFIAIISVVITFLAVQVTFRALLSLLMSVDGGHLTSNENNAGKSDSFVGEKTEILKGGKNSTFDMFTTLSPITILKFNSFLYMSK